jgi:hypothetical protein
MKTNTIPVRPFIAATLALVTLFAELKLRADVISDWNDTAIRVIKAVNPNPLPASRALAMTHGAQFDAVLAVAGGYEPYAARLSAPGASPEAAAAQAAYHVLTNLYPAQTAALDTALSASLASVPDGPAKTDGIGLGNAAAAAILALRASDGSTTPLPYAPGSGPGVWVPTPPAFAPALLPHWRNVTPFTMDHPAQFRPDSPPALDSATYTADFAEIKAIGETNSATRAVEQTATALFHIEFVPYTLGSAARYALGAQPLPLIESARLFALLNLAMADSFISVWDAKFEYNYWRPITAIRAADTDGNAATEPDPIWTPLRATPPHPEYPAAHTIAAGAGAEVLAAVFGDTFSFTIESPTLPGQPRTFARFSDFPMESGNARVWAGFHWRNSTAVGEQMGRRIAQQALGNFLQKIEPPVIVTQPQNQTNVAGTTATFSVVATGTSPLTYQWRAHFTVLQFTNIPWGTEATLRLTNVQPTTARYAYAVVVSNAYGVVTSSPLGRLTVLVPATITRQPAATVTAEAGNSATFSVTVTGTPPLTVQWRFNESPLANKTNVTLVLTNLQFTDAGGYSVVAANPYGADTSQVARLTVIPPVFTKMTNAATIVLPVASGAGAAWGDFDNDGDEDLFVATRMAERDLLYGNNGNGTFSLLTNNPIVAGAEISAVGLWADYDNDGDLDLFVAGGNLSPVLNTNSLFRNDGAGAFTRVRAGPLTTDLLDTSVASWGDFDNDGFIDLFTARGENSTNVLYRNSGESSFTRTANTFGSQTVATYGCAWADYDNDGRLDLCLIGATNFLYRNLSSGQFESIVNRGISPATRESIICSWGDYDNDGFLDLYVAEGGTIPPPGVDRLFHNDGNGGFEQITNSGISTEPGWGTGCSWADFDNDGFLDLLTCRQNNTDNILYHNEGNGTFSRLTRGSLGTIGGNSVTGVWGDYDNDGFLDLFVSNGGFVGVQSSFLYRNNGNANAWLKLKLVGSVANRAAIGAKVRVRAVIGGTNRWQMREISGGAFGMNSLISHFGLGDATNADLVRIEWPSGTAQELRNVATRQSLTLTEPPHLQATLANGQLQLALTAWPGQRFAVETSTNLTDWTPFATLTNTSRTATLTDTLGSPQRFYRATP